jgi:cytosine/adenosine deaminase-related metal-dependent hydrolase
MRKISADYIYTIVSEPLKNGIITISDDGTILDVGATNLSLKDVEHFEGIICPGFINTHCHLELSHFKGRITENSGMTGFIKELLSARPTFSSVEITRGIEAAEAEMIKNGIVAVGDISNDNSTFRQKSKKNLKYHTFLEVFDLNPAKAEDLFEAALELKKELGDLPSSIVPHAPYTVSEKLFRLINAEARKNNSILSIHNQESKGESELFESHSGPMFEAFSKMGVDLLHFPASGKNSLRTTLTKLPPKQKILLVHNTFTSAEDIEWARSQISDLFWCTCPNANLYIENRLPDYDIFIKADAKMTIGTDSLASNRSLSVLDELKVITKNGYQIPMQTLLTWATKNGAEFLGFEELGTIEKGKKPGLNLLTKLKDGMITPETEVMKLI